MLGELGFDDLPYWKEEPAEFRDQPLRLFTGVREDPFFQTGHRHIAALRARAPEPLIYLNAVTAHAHGIEDGAMAAVETSEGRVTMKVAVRDDMPADLVRVPHGWWLPEEVGSKERLSGAWEMADAQLCRDDDDFLDAEQGIPHLKGIPCRLSAA